MIHVCFVFKLYTNEGFVHFLIVLFGINYL